MHDVLIVGAGPVGSFTAARLAKRGLSVALIEEDPSSGHSVVCTGVIGVEAFERYDLPKEAILSELQTVRFFSPSGNALSYNPTSTQAFVVNRQVFDQELAETAVREGAQAYFDARVERIEAADDCVTVHAASARHRRTFRGRLAVLACGYNPMLTTGMGLGAPPGYLQGVQTEVEMESTGATEIYMGRDVAPRSFAWVVPVSSDRCRVGLTTARDATSYLKKLLNSPFLRDRVRSGSPVIQASTIPVGLIPRSSAPRVLVVGEAAGQVKTTTGGGIYYGLLCSEILEEVVVPSFHSGDLGCETLMDYERKWKEKIGSELRMGWFLRQVGGKLKDSHLDALIEIANRDGIMPIVHNMAHFDWHRDLIFSVFKHLFYNGGLRNISLTAR